MYSVFFKMSAFTLIHQNENQSKDQIWSTYLALAHRIVHDS